MFVCNLKRIICYTTLTITTTHAAGATAPDDRSAWIKENAVTVRTIEPTDGDFRDLLPLKELIGDARVVALGEQSHGDGATYHAKTRLIKFLHEEMGFDVLVWQSGMFECRLVERELAKGMRLKEAWLRGITFSWGVSQQVQPLFEYIQSTRKTDTPLEIAGMTAHITGPGTAVMLDQLMDSLVDKAGPSAELRQAFADLDLVIEKMKVDPRHQRSIEQMNSRPPVITVDDFKSTAKAVDVICSELENSESALASAVDEREGLFISQTLRNFATVLEMKHWMSIRPLEPVDPEEVKYPLLKRTLILEPAISQSLIFLAKEYYADRKLIVWAGSNHLIYNSETIEMRDEDGEFKLDDSKFKPMGNTVHEALGDDFYVIHFIANSGKYGNTIEWSREVEPAEEGSIDAICSETGEPYLFVDLRTLPDKEGGSWLRERLIARPRGYSPMRAVWPDVCDAFFFTDKMYPSTRAGN